MTHNPWPTDYPVAGADFVARALKHIEGKDEMQQLDLLRQYVSAGEHAKLPNEEINPLRQQYIRIASALYRERIPA